MMYMIYSKDHIHHLLNESKKYIFPYNRDRRIMIYCENLLLINIVHGQS